MLAGSFLGSSPGLVDDICCVHVCVLICLSREDTSHSGSGPTP